MEQVYAALVETPLGLRTGKITFEVVNNKISGVLELLGKTEKFDGIIKKNNEIEIKGTISLATRQIQYRGTGVLEEEHVELELEGGRNRLKLKGNRWKE